MIPCKSATGLPSPFHHVSAQYEGASYEPGRGLSPKCYHVCSSSLNFPVSGTISNKFLWFISDLVCGISLLQLKQTKTIIKLRNFKGRNQ